MHALRRPHPKPPALLGQCLDLVGPHAGGVDHNVAAHLGDCAVLRIADRHPGDPVALAQQRHHLTRRPHHRAVLSRRARHRHRVPGVVDDGVEIADAADQRSALQARRQSQRARAGQMLLGGNGFRAAELVIKQDARRHVRPFPPPLGQREQERQRLDQMRRQRGQRQLALMQRFADQPELQLLEVAQPAVEHLRAAAGGAGGEVAGLDERHLEPAGGRVQGGARPDHAAADDDDVELFAAEPLPGLFPLLGAQEGLPLARCGVRVNHFEWTPCYSSVRFRPSQATWAQSKSSCAISRRPASVIDPDSDGYTENVCARSLDRVAVLHRQRDRQDQLRGDRRDHHAADHHAGRRAAEDLHEAAPQARHLGAGVGVQRQHDRAGGHGTVVDLRPAARPPRRSPAG